LLVCPKQSSTYVARDTLDVVLEVMLLHSRILVIREYEINAATTYAILALNIQMVKPSYLTCPCINPVPLYSSLRVPMILFPIHPPTDPRWQHAKGMDGPSGRD
jgi:hypothetical protein